MRIKQHLRTICLASLLLISALTSVLVVMNNSGEHANRVHSTVHANAHTSVSLSTDRTSLTFNAVDNYTVINAIINNPSGGTTWAVENNNVTDCYTFERYGSDNAYRLSYGVGKNFVATDTTIFVLCTNNGVQDRLPIVLLAPTVTLSYTHNGSIDQTNNVITPIINVAGITDIATTFPYATVNYNVNISLPTGLTFNNTTGQITLEKNKEIADLSFVVNLTLTVTTGRTVTASTQVFVANYAAINQYAITTNDLFYLNDEYELTALNSSIVQVVGSLIKTQNSVALNLIINKQATFTQPIYFVFPAAYLPTHQYFANLNETYANVNQTDHFMQQTVYFEQQNCRLDDGSFAQELPTLSFNGLGSGNNDYTKLALATNYLIGIAPVYDRTIDITDEVFDAVDFNVLTTDPEYYFNVIPSNEFLVEAFLLATPFSTQGSPTYQGTNLNVRRLRVRNIEFYQSGATYEIYRGRLYFNAASYFDENGLEYHLTDAIDYLDILFCVNQILFSRIASQWAQFIVVFENIYESLFNFFGINLYFAPTFADLLIVFDIMNLDSLEHDLLVTEFDFIPWDGSLANYRVGLKVKSDSRVYFDDYGPLYFKFTLVA